MDPLIEVVLPNLPREQASWARLQGWWQVITDQLTRAVRAQNEAITEIADAQAAATAAQIAANAAQDDAIAAQADATQAIADALAAATTAATAVQQDQGPAWAAATGTAARTTFATYAGQTVSNPPTQAEMQAIDDHVKLLSQRMKALVDDLKGNGALT